MAAVSSAPVNDKREIFGWTMYDWANSAFSTTVVTVFLGPYLTSVAEAAADANGFLRVLGFSIRYDSFFTYCVSLSVLLQVFVLPVLGAIADYSHLRKRMLVLFATLGAVISEADLPLENRARSRPVKSAVSVSSTMISSFPHRRRRPAERADAKNRISVTGNWRSSSTLRITPPTCPVAPKTPTRMTPA